MSERVRPASKMIREDVEEKRVTGNIIQQRKRLFQSTFSGRKEEKKLHVDKKKQSDGVKSKEKQEEIREKQKEMNKILYFMGP